MIKNVMTMQGRSSHLTAGRKAVIEIMLRDGMEQAKSGRQEYTVEKNPTGQTTHRARMLDSASTPKTDETPENDGEPVQLELISPDPENLSEAGNIIPAIIRRAMTQTLTDIGQLTTEERKTLAQYVKKGYLSKGTGGSFPNMKTVYACPSFDFQEQRQQYIADLMKTI